MTKKIKTKGFGTFYETHDGYTTRDKNEAKFIGEIHEECENDRASQRSHREMRGIWIDNKEREIEILENKLPVKLTQPSISSFQDFWTIYGVNYRGNINIVDLLKKPLDNRRIRTQDEWVEYSKKAKKQGEFYVGSMSFLHALFSTLSRVKEDPRTELAKYLIKEEMEGCWHPTLTKIIYKQEKDEVIHNIGMDNEYSIEENIKGPSEDIKHTKNSDYIEAILNTKDIQEINKTYQWMDKEEGMHIWREAKKPEKIGKCVVGFVSPPGSRFYLSADNLEGDSFGPAFGIRIKKVFNTAKVFEKGNELYNKTRSEIREKIKGNYQAIEDKIPQ